MWPEEPVVAVTFTIAKSYPERLPFNPPEAYPEYRGNAVDPQNEVYAGVRETLYRLGLDRANYGTPHWNPLGEVIRPGMTVLIKPNLVRHNHLAGGDVLAVIVHASILRPLLDYISIALKGEGRIIVGDTQTIASQFDAALKASQIGDLLIWYSSQADVPIECIDFRTHHAVPLLGIGEWGRERLSGDPRGYRLVNLGERSRFTGIDPHRLRIAIGAPKNMYKHHSGGRHEYLLPRTVLESDVIVSIPKMKTHRRTGVTMALKNFMGLPGWKETLPHFMLGSPEEGGDQYKHPSWRKRLYTQLQDRLWDTDSAALKLMYAVLKKGVWFTRHILPFEDNLIEGKWYGNDTLWRTLLDLHHAALYADADGNLHETPQRRLFCFLDGIIAGEGNGPSQPDAMPAGVLMASFHPAAMDAVAASLMGFDIDKIPLVAKALEESDRLRGEHGATRQAIEVLDCGSIWSLATFQQQRNLHFAPHPNWKGHIERVIEEPVKAGS